MADEQSKDEELPILGTARPFVRIGVQPYIDPEDGETLIEVQLVRAVAGQANEATVFHLTTDQAIDLGLVLVGCVSTLTMFVQAEEYVEGLRKANATDDVHTLEHFLEYLGGMTASSHKGMD